LREAKARGYKVVAFEDGTTVIIADSVSYEPSAGRGK
jgi:hypothetical protein